MKKTKEWYEKKRIQNRMNEIFKDYALDEEDEEYAHIYMLFRHRNGETQTKCLRFHKSFEQPEETGDAFKDMGFVSASDIETPESIGIDWLWKSINDESPVKDAFWICTCSLESWQFTYNHFKCSRCNNYVSGTSKYCPNCGSRMCES